MSSSGKWTPLLVLQRIPLVNRFGFYFENAFICNIRLHPLRFHTDVKRAHEQNWLFAIIKNGENVMVDSCSRCGGVINVDVDFGDVSVLLLKTPYNLNFAEVNWVSTVQRIRFKRLYECKIFPNSVKLKPSFSWQEYDWMWCEPTWGVVATWWPSSCRWWWRAWWTRSSAPSTERWTGSGSSRRRRNATPCPDMSAMFDNVNVWNGYAT